MELPSRDQLGTTLSAGPWVNCRGELPLASTTQTSQPPSFPRASNASHLPSGDQRGVPLHGLPMLVIWAAPVPSAFATQTAKLATWRLDSKAILRPSGEYCGARSKALEVRKGVGAPPRSSRQILAFLNVLVKVRRPALKLIAG